MKAKKTISILLILALLLSCLPMRILAEEVTEPYSDTTVSADTNMETEPTGTPDNLGQDNESLKPDDDFEPAAPDTSFPESGPSDDTDSEIITSLQLGVFTSGEVDPATGSVTFTYTSEYTCYYIWQFINADSSWSLTMTLGGLDFTTTIDYQSSAELEVYQTAGNLTIMKVHNAPSEMLQNLQVAVYEAHRIEETVKKPTCYESGLHTYACTECSFIHSEEIPVSHTYKNGYCTLCGTEEYLTGTLGNGLSWTFTGGNGTLTFSGTGAIPDNNSLNAPWAYAETPIKKVVLGEGITRIGECAFMNLINLEEVQIASTVTEIGGAAFYETALETIKFPAALTALGSSVFYGCGELKTVVFTGDAPTFDEWAFQGFYNTVIYPAENETWTEDIRQNYHGNVTWLPIKTDGTIGSGSCGDNVMWELNIDGTMTISGTGAMDNFTFQNYGNETPWYDLCQYINKIIIETGVTAIGNGSFADCMNLTSVIIPEGVTYIGDNAFYYCETLHEITLPKTLEVIGRSAFGGCHDLSAITLPNGLKEIGAYAFWECWFEEMYIGPNVTSIGEGTFEYYPVWIDEANQYYRSDKNGCVYTKDMKTLLHAKDLEGIFYIPDTVETIKSNACAYIGAAAVVIPKSVTTIENSAFYECGAEIVVFTGGAPQLTDSFVFADPTFYYPAQDSSWTEEVRMSVCWMYDTTWVPCPDIVILRQPESVETTNGKTVSVSTEAFGNGLTYEWWVRDPGATSFRSTGVTGMEYSTVVTTANAGQRVYCLITDENGNRIKTDVVTLGFYPELKLGEIIEAKTDEEYAYAFVQFTPTLTCQYTFRTLYDWYNNSFRGMVCDVDGNVLFDQDEDDGLNFQITCQLEAGKTYLFGIRGGYTATSEDVLLEGHNLTSTITKEPNCTQTGEMSCYCELCGNSWIEIIPESHNYVDGYCISCQAPRVVTGMCGPDVDWKLEGDTVTIWGTGVMWDYYLDAPWSDYSHDIKKVVITRGVTSIGSSAFNSCENLTDVTIADSVERIGNSAFNYCTSLAKVTIPAGVKVIESDAFRWTNLQTVVIPDSVTTIGYGAFERCPYLTDIFIGTGVTSLDDIASYSPNLQGIWVDERNTAYCNDAYGILFNKDKSVLISAPPVLSGAYAIPASVKTISSDAFEDCALLNKVSIPDSVISIEYGAFAGCTGLTQVVFGDTRPEMNSYCFEGVTATVTYPAESENWSYYDMDNYGGSLLWIDTNGNATNYELSGANVLLGSSLAMNFFVDKNYLYGSDYYALVIHYTQDGEHVYTIPYDQWSERTNYMVVTLDNLSAKQMTDQIEVRIYHADGSAASYTWYDSIRDYTMRIFDKQNDETKTLLVDMLNYGAAAQNYFEYNAYDLANNQLSDEQLSYATQSVTCTNQRVKGDNYYGSTLTLKNRIQLTAYFQNITTDMYAVVSYTDHYGNIEEYTVSGSEFSQYNSNTYGVIVDTLAVADGDQLVSVTVYDEQGQPIAYAADTVNGYLSRMMNDDALFEAIAKFTNSAYSYFH